MKTYFSNEMLNKCSRHFSESAFVEKLKSIGVKIGEKFLYHIFLLYYMYKSDKVSAKDKAIIIGCLGYFILPTDIVADMLPMIGFTDDMAVISIVVRKLAKNITLEVKNLSKQHILRLKKGK